MEHLFIDSRHRQHHRELHGLQPQTGRVSSGELSLAL